MLLNNPYFIICWSFLAVVVNAPSKTEHALRDWSREVNTMGKNFSSIPKLPRPTLFINIKCVQGPMGVKNSLLIVKQSDLHGAPKDILLKNVAKRFLKPKILKLLLWQGYHLFFLFSIDVRNKILNV